MENSKQIRGGKRQGAGRKASPYPKFLKEFRATENEWKEFLELCPDDAREAFVLVYMLLQADKAMAKRIVDAELKLEPWRSK